MLDEERRLEMEDEDFSREIVVRFGFFWFFGFACLLADQSKDPIWTAPTTRRRTTAHGKGARSPPSMTWSANARLAPVHKPTAPLTGRTSSLVRVLRMGV